MQGDGSLDREPRVRTLVLALGNPILGDDGVGWVVGREICRRVGAEGVDLVEAAVGGLGILSLFSRYAKVIIVDAIQTRGGRPGALYRFQAEDLLPTLRLSGTHGVSLGQALKLGADLGYPLPRDLAIYAIEVVDPFSFREELTPEVEGAVSGAVETILQTEFASRS